LTTDGAALAVVIAGASASSGTVVMAGFGTYVFGAPTVHGIHRHVGKAFGSFGLRVGLPIGGFFVGYAATKKDCSNDESTSDFCGLEGVAGGALGMLVGMGAAIAIDSAVLAREDVPKRAASARVELEPVLTLTPRFAGAGVRGSF
jgi:hypothetical protein